MIHVRFGVALSVSLMTCAVGAGVDTAAAQAVRVQGPQVQRVDPAVRSALTTTAPSSRAARSGRGTTVHAVVELVSEHALGALLGIESNNLQIARIHGEPVSYKRWAPVTVNRAGLAMLETSPFVSRVRSEPPAGRLPMNRSAELLGLSGARGTMRDGNYGRGTLIADLDSTVDVLHPAFFHGDGGWYDWIDVDGDGVLTPGVDAVDLDANGEASAEETAVLLPATQLTRRPGMLPARPEFVPATDWIYLDVNGDGVRNVGAREGFEDSVPGFGEPIFVPDDVDGDGQIGRAERLVRLGTSKIREELFVDATTAAPTLRLYTRGTRLSSAPLTVDAGGYHYDSMHGTGVASILVGDVPLVGRRFVGVAPEAEIVVGAVSGSDNSTARFMWALSKHPDVMLHEYVDTAGIVLDGSDVISEMIDASSHDENIAHVCAAGNIGLAAKHGHFEVAAGATRDVSISGMVESPLYQLSVMFRADPSVRFELVEPDGTTVRDLSVATLEEEAIAIYTTRETSSRGYERLYAAVWGPENGNVATGEWKLRVHSGSAAVTIDAFLFDYGSGFDVGFHFDDSVATPTSTMGWPSTADSCVAVGATPAHAYAENTIYDAPVDNESVGELRAYSARGPRIDLARTISVTAPDNPWAAYPRGRVAAGAPLVPQGAYGVFGGTSGASPHVAGVLALLAQSGTRGRDAIDRITASADHVAGDDVNHAGAGRLNAAAALGGTHDGAPPTITLSTSASATGWKVTPTVTDSDGDAALVQVRWDDGYDGSWENDWAAPVDRTVAPGRYKVRARDATGRVAEAVLALGALPVTMPEMPVPPRAKSSGCTVVDAHGNSNAIAALFGVLALLSATARRARKAR